MLIKWRSWFKGIPPKPIKLKIPGWAGDSHGHSNGDKPQPWHCPPFREGSVYGLELIYPFETECHVKNINGKIIFEGDFELESNQSGVNLPPFSAFAPDHFGFTSSLDLMPPENHIIRIEPHPRFYVDNTGTVPCAITGHLQSEWWPKFFFVVFKSPRPGECLIFKHQEPYAQILVLPKKIDYEIVEMTPEEKTSRKKLEEKIINIGPGIATNTWKDHLGNKFDDKYKVFSGVFSKGGFQGLQDLIAEKEKRPNIINKKMKTRIVKKKS